MRPKVLQLALLHLRQKRYVRRRQICGILTSHRNQSARIGQLRSARIIYELTTKTLIFSFCVNTSPDFPEFWSHPTLQDAYLHETADSCCEMWFFSWGKSCVLEDVCSETAVEELASSSTTSTSSSVTNQATDDKPCGYMWHPSSGFKSCTNR